MNITKMAVKTGNAPVNLSINTRVANAARTFVINNRRPGQMNLSEWTAKLWIAYLRRQGVKLPARLNGKAAR